MDDDKKLQHPAALEPLDNPPKRHFAAGLLGGLLREGFDARLGGTLALIEHRLSRRHENRDPIEIQLNAVDAIYKAYSAAGCVVSIADAPQSPHLHAIVISHPDRSHPLYREPMFVHLRTASHLASDDPHMAPGFGPVISREQALGTLVRRVIDDAYGSVLPYVDLAYAYSHAQLAETAVLAGDYLSASEQLDYWNALRDCVNVPTAHLARADPLMEPDVVRSTAASIAEYVPAGRRVGANALAQQQIAEHPDEIALANAYDHMAGRSRYAWAVYTALEVMREQLRLNIREMQNEQGRERDFAMQYNAGIANVTEKDPVVQALARLCRATDVYLLIAQVRDQYAAKADLHQQRVEELEGQIRTAAYELHAIAREVSYREHADGNVLVLENTLRRGWQDERAKGARVPVAERVIPAAASASLWRPTQVIAPGWAGTQKLPGPLPQQQPSPPSQSY
jgi:hypothetical protein